METADYHLYRFRQRPVHRHPGKHTGDYPKVLAKELKDLEQHQLIKRVIIEDYPVKISYKLEEYADTLSPVIYALKDWGVNHRRKIFEKE